MRPCSDSDMLRRLINCRIIIIIIIEYPLAKTLSDLEDNFSYYSWLGLGANIWMLVTMNRKLIVKCYMVISLS